MPTTRMKVSIAAGLMTLLAVACGAAEAQPLSEEGQANVQLIIEPVAALTFTAGNLLYLEVPPAHSTIPSSGVGFTVVGNASAILTAEPDAFIQVPVEDYVGAAYLSGNAVGYKVELRFPNTGVPGSPVQIAALPGFEAGSTVPPLAVNLALTGGERQGVIHMESSAEWTVGGSLPLPGLYVGSVVLTLTADY